jgi:rod shape-determining protein MreD
MRADSPIANFWSQRASRSWYSRVLNIITQHLPGIVFLITSLVQSVNVWGPAGSSPDLPIILLYHWTVYQPLPVLYLLIAGIIQDGLINVLFGTHTLVYIIMYYGILYQRRYILGQSFAKIWIAFASACIIASVLKYVAFCFSSSICIDVLSWVLSLLLTMSAYPLIVGVILIPMHHFILRYQSA